MANFPEMNGQSPTFDGTGKVEMHAGYTCADKVAPTEAYWCLWWVRGICSKPRRISPRRISPRANGRTPPPRSSNSHHTALAENPDEINAAAAFALLPEV